MLVQESLLTLTLLVIVEQLIAVVSDLPFLLLIIMQFLFLVFCLTKCEG